MTTPFSHRKSLGQNFLHNQEVIRRSVEAGKLVQNDVVLEIGPGQGALTRLLLESPCSFVHAVEIDRRLEPWLIPLEAQNSGRLCVHWQDSLECDLSSLSPQPNKVLANIPYNITTDLLWKILSELAPLKLETVVLLIQKEAAERLRAAPCTKQRGPLGVTLEMMGTVSPVMNVAPGSFSPPPKVWSEVILIQLAQNCTLANERSWRRLISTSFAQRRKKLINNLRRLTISESLILSLFSKHCIDPNTRAEELTREQWQALYTSLKEQI